jgi:hypothetical protein
VTEAYYPRHGGEQGVGAEELELARLQDRVHRLEMLLRDASAYVSDCTVPECDCIGRRIQAELGASRAD